MVKTLNNNPKSGGLLDVLSPITLITGFPPPDYKAITNLSFSEYVEVMQASGFRNSMQQRTTGALALYPSAKSNWWEFQICKRFSRTIRRYIG